MSTPASQTQKPTPTATTWTIDPAHTTVGFAVKHMMFATVRGAFKSARGEVARDEEDVTRSTLRVEVDAASIDTGAPDRDAHLRSADFFDVENHPTLVFESRRIESVGDDRFRLVGDLTIRGVTREVAFDTVLEGEGRDPWGNLRAGATAEARIRRKDFGLTWNQALEAGGVLVGDEVRLTLHVQAVRA